MHVTLWASVYYFMHQSLENTVICVWRSSYYIFLSGLIGTCAHASWWVNYKTYSIHVIGDPAIVEKLPVKSTWRGAMYWIPDAGQLISLCWYLVGEGPLVCLCCHNRKKSAGALALLWMLTHECKGPGIIILKAEVYSHDFLPWSLK